MLQLVRDRWSIEGWHWIRDTQLKEDAHRYRGQWCLCDGMSPHRRIEPVATEGICINPLWNADGVPRHHGDAGDGTTKV